MDYKGKLTEITKRAQKASSAPWLGIFTSLAAGIPPKPEDVDFQSHAADDITDLLTIVLHLERRLPKPIKKLRGKKVADASKAGEE